MILLTAWAFVVFNLYASDPNDKKSHLLLKEGVDTIHLIWTDWMNKPKLEYKNITSKSLERLYGTWLGSSKKSEEEVDFQIALNSNGKWHSKTFRPNMENGHWYLHDGMILLYESKLSNEANLASALTLGDKGLLKLLFAENEDGFIQLELQNK